MNEYDKKRLGYQVALSIKETNRRLAEFLALKHRLKFETNLMKALDAHIDDGDDLSENVQESLAQWRVMHCKGEPWYYELKEWAWGNVPSVGDEKGADYQAVFEANHQMQGKGWDCDIVVPE